MKLGYDVRINGKTEKHFFDKKSLEADYLKLICDVDEPSGVRHFRLEVQNNSGVDMEIERANIVITLPAADMKLDYFTSRWGKEFTPAFADEAITFGSYRGKSSSGSSPFFQLSSEHYGCFGVAVGWSGNWEASFDPCGEIVVGLADDGFMTVLKPGNVFRNIDIYCCHSEYDAEAMAAAFRDYHKRKISLMSGCRKMPIIFNHWMPYSDKLINHRVFMENAKEAKDLGLTHAILDAAWYGGDNDWHTQQGDWDVENKTRFPHGIAALGDEVNALGIDFGIWCEPESVGSNSALLKKRPDLVAMKDGEYLDYNYICMGNPESVRWALEIVDKLVLRFGAKWLKFDFNRLPGFGCTSVKHGHGEKDGLYAHVTGFYRFLESVREKYPDIIIENCSAGGMRMDYGIMKRCHLHFLSDVDNTPHHFQCKWGALGFIHQNSLFHFSYSQIPGDWNPVREPISEDMSREEFDYMIRAVLVGVPGFSLRLPELPDWIKARMKEHVSFYHRISDDYIRDGKCFRLTQTADGPNAYQLNAANGNAIVFIFGPQTVRLRGLIMEAEYELSFQDSGLKMRKTGRELVEEGVTIESELPGYSEIIFVNIGKKT